VNRIAWRAHLIALISVVAATLLMLPMRETLTLANITMVFLLLVVLIAVTQGTAPALVTTFASFFSINYFFVPPFYTLWVADSREVLDLFVFMVVAGIAGRLGAYSRQQAEIARQRAREQELLYRLTRTLNQFTTREQILDVLTQTIKVYFGAQQVDVLPRENPLQQPESHNHYLLLQASEQIYGTLRVSFNIPLEPSQRDLLGTCVAQAAMALQRIDLTERARKSQQFEDADRLKTALLHAVSHDLRTPITIIKSSASNLRKFGDSLSRDERTELTETIESESDQLDRLVGNLLDMSRLQAGALQLNLSLNSFEEVAGDVAARAWHLTHQERLELNFPDDLPLVEFDYGLILQALTNLVQNALRYEPLSQKVQLEGAVKGKQAVLRIINHGETIDFETKARMMEPFFRGKEGRIGLGMPIAKGIVEAHHGELWVEDTPGGGATFVIALPLKEQIHLETQVAGG